MATDPHATTTIDIHLATHHTPRHIRIAIEAGVPPADQSGCAAADLLPPIDLADFAHLMRQHKLEAARRLAHLAAQPGGERLLYRQAEAWAGYLIETSLFPGHDVWLPDDVLANFACAIRVYLASQGADDARAA